MCVSVRASVEAHQTSKQEARCKHSDRLVRVRVGIGLGLGVKPCAGTVDPNPHFKREFHLSKTNNHPHAAHVSSAVFR